MRIDVICLTNTASDIYLKMCLETLSSLFRSESEYLFDVVLVEGREEPHQDFYKLVEFFPGNTIRVINPNEEFNYNRFLNFAMSEITGADWMVVINNDLIFETGWFSEIMKLYMDRPDILAFSPFEPDCHNGFFGKFDNYASWIRESRLINKNHYVEGYVRGYHVAGWCLVLHRTVMDVMGSWDERFPGWCQDDDYAEFLRYNNIKNALVAKSRVHHLKKNNPESINHRLVPERLRWRNVGEGSIIAFNEKWTKNSNPSPKLQ